MSPTSYRAAPPRVRIVLPPQETEQMPLVVFVSTAGRCLAMDTNSWLRGPDLNRRPSGYEPDELPSCSTPRPNCIATTKGRAVAPCCLRLHRRALPAMDTNSWLRGPDLNRRPSGYEPDELPSCSTPRPNCTATTRGRAVASCCLRLHRCALRLPWIQIVGCGGRI